MIDAIAVADERVGDAAQFQQAIPIGIVPRQARDFQAEDNTHVRHRHFAGEASEAGAPVGAGTGQPEILIDDHYLVLGPAELRGAIGQGVLAGGGLPIVFDLAWRGLANVDIGGALEVRGFDLGRISHWPAPGGGESL